MAKRTQHLYLWQTLTGAALVGATASFIQIIERIQYAEEPTEQLFCNLNNVISCSNVFASWQSSVFGFSNAIMCLAFFAALFGVGLAGLTGAELSRNLRAWLQGFSVFFLLFGAWYLWQSTYVIGALCIFCIFCYAAVMLMNFALLRLNADDFPLKSVRDGMSWLVARNADVVLWMLWALTVASWMVLRFAL